MKKILKLGLYFIALPLVLFFLANMYSVYQTGSFGGYSKGFPFQYYYWSSGNCGTLEEFKSCETYNIKAFILNLLVYYLISLVLYMLIEVRAAKSE
ncbi:MAG: hypothetical protein AABX33_01155 [Nanoarchaeota archaeon]